MNPADLPDHILKRNPGLCVGPEPAQAPKPHQARAMNKTEREWYTMISARADVIRVKFEAVKFRLGYKCHYTPDFLVEKNRGPVVVYEVKGPYIREDGMIKFKAAAALYPMFEWVLAQKTAAGWQVREY